MQQRVREEGRGSLALTVRALLEGSTLAGSIVAPSVALLAVCLHRVRRVHHALTAARPSPIPPDARTPRAQGSSGATATVPFLWRGHTKSRTTRAGRAPELALRLG